MNGFYEKRFAFELGNVPISIYENEDFNFLAHWHHEYELAWVEEGCVDIGINHQISHLQQGDILLCQSGAIHYYESKSADSKVHILVFKNDLVDDFSKWMDSLKPISPVFTQIPIENVQIYELLHQIRSEKATAQVSYNQMIRSLLMQLLILLMRLGTVHPSTKPTLDTSRLAMLQQLLVYIESHISDDLKLEVLAKQYGIDPFYLSKLFNALTGMHFKMYLNKSRIALACDLLKNPALSMIEVSMECGFNTVRNFNRVFKSLQGVSPSAYREIL